MKHLSLLERQNIFAKNVGTLLGFIGFKNHMVTLGEAFRTKEQAELYAQSGKGIKNSLHCKRLAIDINIFDAKGTYLEDSQAYEFAGTFWESLHADNRWGGRFSRPDGGHFEMMESHEDKR